MWVKEGGGNKRLERSFMICTEHIIRMIISRRRRHVACVWGKRNAFIKEFCFLETRRKETTWRK
jgi:uracil DNA glycosylase